METYVSWHVNAKGNKSSCLFQLNTQTSSYLVFILLNSTNDYMLFHINNNPTITEVTNFKGCFVTFWRNVNASSWTCVECGFYWI